MNEHPWLNKFRLVVNKYYESRYDPFMTWFQQIRRDKGFQNDFHAIITVLINARFDQGTTAEKALMNTRRVYEIALRKDILLREIPPLEGRARVTKEQWRILFHKAIPHLHAVAETILTQKRWEAPKLQRVVEQIPWMGPKTGRLAVRWLHELIPDIISINMVSALVPIDTLLYRVAARLGILNPFKDRYSGKNSIADQKIQRFAKMAFPKYPVKIDEPMWRMGRSPRKGGHCYPTNPSCHGCLFEGFCPRLYKDFDPSAKGYALGH
jgi:endonuclease III